VRLPLFLLLTWPSLAIAAPAPTPAQPAQPVAAAAVEGDILSYYGGEEASAWVVLGLSVACVGAGLPLVAQRSDFARGAGVPLLSLGALEGIGAVFYVFQVRAEIAHYRGQLATDPAGFRRDELAHIEGTQARFVYYRAVELALTVAGAGLATYGVVANQDLFKGVGVGLFAIGLPFLIIDTVNNGRAGRYHEQLRRFDPTLALQHDERGWRLALSGRF
jgi:hypothetical protein